MRTLAILLLFCITACDASEEYYVAPELADYVESFYFEADSRGVSLQRSNLVIKLGGLPERIDGQTRRSVGDFSGDQITVIIDSEFFSSSSRDCIEWVVYHELGHALLNRDHVGGYSYMNDLTRCYTNSTAYWKPVYLDEMFKH
jgi:hypothetical protein